MRVRPHPRCPLSELPTPAGGSIGTWPQRYLIETSALTRTHGRFAAAGGSMMYRSGHSSAPPDARRGRRALTCPDWLPTLTLGTKRFMKWQLNPQVVSRRVGASSVLVHLDSNAIYELNMTGARVVDLLGAGDRECVV